MIQEFINKYFYSLFLITLVFGVILYGLTNFQAIDEICSILLFILFLYFMFNTKDWEINKIFLYVLFAFTFYLCYSLLNHSNSTQAIFMDFIIQLKPYIALFCTYQLKPVFSEKQTIILRQLSLLFWIILLPIGITGIFYHKIFTITMAHASNFASAVAALALLYLYTSKNTPKDRIIFILMLSLGLISGRAKFYGFFVFSSFIILYLSNASNLKLNFKNILLFTGLCALIILVAKDKIALYFLQGISDEAEKDYVARFALYATSFQIFNDYFPFGSGFASFATHASGVYYSPIYAEYQIDGIWGISKSYKSFISDTYYPSLAQFGIIGVGLFISFWIYILRKAAMYFKKTNQTNLTIITLIIVGYFTIENIADATFTSNRGFFFMMFLGLILSNMKYGYATTLQKSNPNKINIE